MPLGNPGRHRDAAAATMPTRALAVSLLLGLSRADFEGVLDNYPDSRIRIENAAAGRLRELREKESAGAAGMDDKSFSSLGSVGVGRRMSLAAASDKRGLTRARAPPRPP